jgi:type I restriction enzyme R subunit
MTREAISDGVMIEADTCREFVTLQLAEASSAAAPHAIGE